MTQTMRSAIVPIYILVCVVLGGSVQGYWAVATLQLLAIAIIGGSLLLRDPVPLSRSAKALFAIVGLTVLLVLLQLIPLPPAVWTALPGRQPVKEGYALLGQGLPWLSVSLTPYDTAATSLTLLPPVAVLTAMLVARAYRVSWLVYAILIGVIAGVLLGALQVSSAIPNESPWYLYRRTNFGFATGFFANSNHMAIMLVISVPLLFAVLADLRKKSQDASSESARVIFGIAGILVITVGVVLNGSLAVLLLGPPVAVGSFMLLGQKRMRLRIPMIAMFLLSSIVILVVYLTPLQHRLGASNATSFYTRETIWSNTVPAIQDHWLLGSGIGSFAKVYPQYEDQAAVTTTFVNHAHNDYLEVALETGISGLVLLLLFLLWWAGRTAYILRMPSPEPYARAAIIASSALLLHSLVDYPLRTAALSTIMAALLAMMVQPRIALSREVRDLWPTRHLSA